MLQAEVTALKTLVITSTPASPNRELHPQLLSPTKAGPRKGHLRHKSTSGALCPAVCPAAGRGLEQDKEGREVRCGRRGRGRPVSEPGPHCAAWSLSTSSGPQSLRVDSAPPFPWGLGRAAGPACAVPVHEGPQGGASSLGDIVLLLCWARGCLVRPGWHRAKGLWAGKAACEASVSSCGQRTSGTLGGAVGTPVISESCSRCLACLSSPLVVSLSLSLEPPPGH